MLLLGCIKFEAFFALIHLLLLLNTFHPFRYPLKSAESPKVF